MQLEEKIYQSIQALPSALQEEVLDFIQYLLLKSERRERQEWLSLSLSLAMRGMEDDAEPEYTPADLKVVF